MLAPPAAPPARLWVLPLPAPLLLHKQPVRALAASQGPGIRSPATEQERLRGLRGRSGLQRRGLWYTPSTTSTTDHGVTRQRPRKGRLRADSLC